MFIDEYCAGVRSAPMGYGGVSLLGNGGRPKVRRERASGSVRRGSAGSTTTQRRGAPLGQGVAASRRWSAPFRGEPAVNGPLTHPRSPTAGGGTAAARNTLSKQYLSTTDIDSGASSGCGRADERRECCDERGKMGRSARKDKLGSEMWRDD
ncbi:hypothetical protein MRX96_026434 [Rhipicephalus microplus]